MIKTEKFGKEDNRTLNTLFDVSKLLLKIGNNDEAYKNYTEIIEIIMACSKYDYPNVDLLCGVMETLIRVFGKDNEVADIFNYLKKGYSYLLIKSSN